ncbi:MAG TPA: hypothetical protein PKD09_09520 [Aggregatilinea sp.]|uniref:coiled-coil domain-containing protein n=1 Tax=Aggregatilinea sp. TaxID=2806333 RepID=UPI002BA222CC|nr:hypothetical protein [Aggregatilinea sp.]HML21876.1 hypothetical protein [Aggregatilinea sp.]
MDIVHEFFQFFLDNLPPLVIALCLMVGAGGGVYFFRRSRANAEVGIYSEALKDVTDALKTSNQTVDSTQKRLTEVHATNISLNEQLSATQGQLKEERKQFEQKLKAEQDQFGQRLREEREMFAKALADAECRIQELVSNAGVLEKARTSDQETIKSLTAKVAVLEEQVRTLETKLKDSEDARAQGNAELVQLRTEVQELRARVARDEEEGREAKAEPTPDTPAADAPPDPSEEKSPTPGE